MDKYDAIETDQDIIDISKLIWTTCHLQYDNIQDVVAAVEIDKQLYMFYQEPYH